jgi:hypothetical protein
MIHLQSLNPFDAHSVHWRERESSNDLVVPKKRLHAFPRCFDVIFVWTRLVFDQLLNKRIVFRSSSSDQAGCSTFFRTSPTWGLNNVLRGPDIVVFFMPAETLHEDITCVEGCSANNLALIATPDPRTYFHLPSPSRTDWRADYQPRDDTVDMQGKHFFSPLTQSIVVLLQFSRVKISKRAIPMVWVIPRWKCRDVRIISSHIQKKEHISVERKRAIISSTGKDGGA